MARYVVTGYAAIEAICKVLDIPTDTVGRLIIDIQDTCLLHLSEEPQSKDTENRCPQCQSTQIIDMTSAGDANRQYACAECGAGWDGERIGIRDS